jgi:predicted transcriptional regulator
MADTTIKIAEETRDRLRQLAEERGLSTRAYVERLAALTPVEAERVERTARAVAYVRANLRPDFTDADVREGQRWREAIAAREVGSRR